MDAALESKHPTEDRSDDLCPNCAHVLDGKYCANCGQKRIDHHEFALRHFFGHLIHEITHLDSNKIIKTFAHLIAKPGLLASEYLAGRKGTYINPIRVYLTVSALYFFFAWGALSNVGGNSVETTAARPNFIEQAHRKGVDPLVLAVKVHEKAAKYSAFLRFGSVLISGLFLALLYRGTGRYYVEHLIFSLYFYSFDFLVKCLVALFYLAIDYTNPISYYGPRTLYYIAVFIYLYFALRQVYREPPIRTAIKATILFGLEVLLFMGLSIVGFILAVNLA